MNNKKIRLFFGWTWEDPKLRETCWTAPKRMSRGCLFKEDTVMTNRKLKEDSIFYGGREYNEIAVFEVPLSKLGWYFHCNTPKSCNYRKNYDKFMLTIKRALPLRYKVKDDSGQGIPYTTTELKEMIRKLIKKNDK